MTASTIGSAHMMTLDEFAEVAERLEWKWVRSEAPGSKMHRHCYVWGDKLGRQLGGERAVGRLARCVRHYGRRGVYVRHYKPEHPIFNDYLVLGEFVYWFIPGQGPGGSINRTYLADQQHDWIEHEDGTTLSKVEIQDLIRQRQNEAGVADPDPLPQTSLFD